MPVHWQRFLNPVEAELDDFEEAYFEAALWSTVDADTGKPLDDCFDTDDVERLMPQWFAEQRRDIADFRDSNAKLLERAGDDAQNGHDFWLTRERHGTGFWDRGYGEAGKKLTDAAHVYGTAGDDISIELSCE